MSILTPRGKFGSKDIVGQSLNDDACTESSLEDMAQPVFISHASLDKAIADKVCMFLEERGISCWIAPRDVPLGAKYGEVIVEAIEGSAAMVLICSEHVNASRHVLKEVERAVNKGKLIIPLMIDQVVPSKELEYFIAGLQQLGVSSVKLDIGLDQLSNELRPLLATESSPLPQNTRLSQEPAMQALRKLPKSLLHIVFGRQLLYVTVVACMLLLVAYMTHRFWFSATTPYASAFAYEALKQGEFSKAETLFWELEKQQESQVKSQGYAGLAALAFARGDYPKSLGFAEQAERLDSENAYIYVIRGDILYNQGKIDKAAAAYRTATDKTHAEPWQKAVAFNRLGRVSASQGHTDDALVQYDNALRQDEDMAVVYANKGHLLQQLGKREEALYLYRRALQINPNDKITATLLRLAERQEQRGRDTEKQQRIDRLVDELVQAHREGKVRESSRDNWTSEPLTIAFLPVQYRDLPTSRAGEEEFLLDAITQALQASGRVTIVEREVLDKLLVELKLGVSELADSQVAAHVGKILAAELIAVTRFIRRGDLGQLSIRLVETETTRVTASVTPVMEQPGPLDGIVLEASEGLLSKVRQIYPLRARLANVAPQESIINIGKEHGVTLGLKLQVFGREEPLEVDGKVFDYNRIPVGLIQVSAVEAKLSRAKVLEQIEPFLPGWKVQEVQQQ